MELWNKIKQKTAYRVQIDTPILIENCVKAIQSMPKINKARLISQTADINIEKSGVSHTEREMRSLDIGYAYGKTYCKNSPTLDEERLHESILEALNRVIRDKDAFMDTFRENVMTILQTDLEYREESNDDMKELQKQIRELIQNNKITDEQEEYEMISRRIDEIRRERIERIKKRGTEESQKLKMEKIYGFLERKHELKEYDDNLVRSLIKTICVINEQKMEIHFKSGTVMTQRIIEKEY